MKITDIEKPELTPGMLKENFDAIEGMQIYSQYLLNNKNLFESNSPEEVHRINLLPSEQPTVNKKYFGLSFVFVNDQVHPYEKFYGKVVDVSKMSNGEFRYKVEFANGDTETYPNETSSLMMYKTLFHTNIQDHNAIEMSLTLSDSASFGPIRK